MALGLSSPVMMCPTERGLDDNMFGRKRPPHRAPSRSRTAHPEGRRRRSPGASPYEPVQCAERYPFKRYPFKAKVYKHIQTYTNVYKRIQTYTNVYTCIRLYMFVYVCICLYTFVYICICLYTWALKGYLLKGYLSVHWSAALASRGGSRRRPRSSLFCF